MYPRSVPGSGMESRPTVGEGEQQREADHLVIRVDGVWLCGLAPDVRVGKGLEIRCDEPLLLGRD